MSVKRRSIIIIMAFAFASVLYGAAKYYSSSIILYVTEQSLAQKAPSGTDRVQLHKRLSTLLATAPNQKEQMQKLLRISEYLEKIQCLAPEDLDRLLTDELPRRHTAGT
jgi:hypothetical protein